MTVGSLFAGIGGFDLGFERAGYDIRWQVEIDPWARAVLAKHWPHVHRRADVRTVGRHNLEPVDVLVGGFPCQDISYAGAGAGLAGKRSGLWTHYLRLIREFRPFYVVVENVPALRSRGLAAILGDLASCGFDAEWQCIPASTLGARHRRNRIWIVAYVADANRARLEGRDDDLRIFGRSSCQQLARARSRAIADRWVAEPAVGRVAHGVSRRVDRLRGLGNAVVPALAEWIAHCITEAEARRVAA